MRRSLRLISILFSISTAVFAQGSHEGAAVFMAGLMPVNTNVLGFGAESSHEQSINNWTDNPGMEPLLAAQYWELTGGGTDESGYYASCNTRWYDSYSSGFYDGAHYRLYRENMTNGCIEKIGEGTIPAGGFVAEGYMQVANIQSSALNSEATDDYLMTNGATWYYAVKAYDIEGKSSGFSAAVPGVVPQTTATNIPFIRPASVANPVVGKVYTESSPFTTLTATGGVPPLRWTIQSGSLPGGMSMNSTGKIYGTCSATGLAVFVVRVTDSMSNFHDRTFSMFRPVPAADGLTPDAPSNVTVQAYNGVVHISWDPVAAGDVSYYQIYRARTPSTQHIERIYLGDIGTVPAAADLLYVDKEFLHAPPVSTRSLRLIQYQTESGWQIKGNRTKLEVVPHPGTLPAAFTNEYPGQGCLKITTDTNESFGIFQYKVGDTSSSWWSVFQLPTGQTYRMECWVYGDGLTNNTLRFQFPNYVDRTITGVVNGVWTKLTVDFASTNWMTNAMSVSGPTLYFRGPGTVYVDNFLVYNISNAPGVCNYSQSVFDLWKSYVGSNSIPKKGVMRIRYNTEPFQNIMSPQTMSWRNWNITYGGNTTRAQHIHDALNEAFATGLSPETRMVPWIITSLSWSEQDFVNLVEYLSGPAGTPYGDLRISQRNGVTTPWIDEFRTIFLEMGNEPWNSGYFMAFRGGFSEASGRTYGRFCNYIWNTVWSNSPYMSDRIQPILGGWNAARASNTFTYAARKECPRSKHVAMSMYLGGWEAGQEGQIGGTTWSDDGVQQWTVFIDRAGRDVVDQSVAMQTNFSFLGLPFDWVVYEGGPSYLMDGLNGVSLTAEEQATSRKYGRTQAAAIGTIDNYLYGMYRNIRENSFFEFSQDRNVWASHTHVHAGYRPHPSVQAVALFNQHVGSSEMLFSAPLSMPSFDLVYDKNGSIVTNTGMGLASAYLFKNGGRYSLLLLNKKVDGVHNGYDFGDGSTPVKVYLPFTAPSSMRLYKIAGDPRETNLEQMNFQVVTQDLTTASFSQSFEVNENSGGSSNGLPTGAIFLYEFDNCTPDAATYPEVFVTQSAGQEDPAIDFPVEFDVFFSEPVSGFSSNDIQQVGSAVAQEITVEETAGQQGAAYHIRCGRITSAGDLTLRIPAGAAISKATGLSSLSSDDGWSQVPSAQVDRTVEILSAPLAEWSYDLTANMTPKPADWVSAGITSAVAALGPGLGLGSTISNSLRVDDFTNDYTIALAVTNRDYFSISLTPSADKGIHLTEARFYQYDLVKTNASLQLYGRISTNGFLTYTDIGSFDGTISAGYSLPVSTALSFSFDAGAGVPVELRFYMVATNVDRYTAWGLGDIGVDGVADLSVHGRLVSAIPDSDGDGLPDSWEVTYFGGTTNANAQAIASNKVNTVKECYIAGLNPNDPESQFQLFGFQNRLWWTAASGRIYSVYWSSNLLNGFQLIGTNIPWTANVFTDSVRGAESSGFYRIKVQAQ